MVLLFHRAFFLVVLYLILYLGWRFAFKPFEWKQEHVDTAKVSHNNTWPMALQFVFVPSWWVKDMSQINTYDKLDIWLKCFGRFFKDREDE